jgi:hypothetical protein
MQRELYSSVEAIKQITESGKNVVFASGDITCDPS